MMHRFQHLRDNREQPHGPSLARAENAGLARLAETGYFFFQSCNGGRLYLRAMAETEFRCASCNNPDPPRSSARRWQLAPIAVRSARSPALRQSRPVAYLFGLTRFLSTGRKSRALHTVIALVVVVGLAVTCLSKILGSAWFDHAQEWCSRPLSGRRKRRWRA